VGTVQLSSGKGSNQPLAGVGFDTPTLYGTWSNPSFFHNGQKATLQDVLAGGHGNASGLPAADLLALGEYVKSFDTAPAVDTRIRSEVSNLCVNVSGGSTASGATVVQWACGNGNNETFTVNSSGGYTQFVAKHSGLCLAQGNTNAGGGPLVQLACTAGMATQWSVVGATLRNRVSPNACLDVPGSSTTQGTALSTYACHGGANQRWNQIP